MEKAIDVLLVRYIEEPKVEEYRQCILNMIKQNDAQLFLVLLRKICEDQQRMIYFELIAQFGDELFTNTVIVAIMLKIMHRLQNLTQYNIRLGESQSMLTSYNQMQLDKMEKLMCKISRIQPEYCFGILAVQMPTHKIQQLFPYIEQVHTLQCVSDYDAIMRNVGSIISYLDQFAQKVRDDIMQFAVVRMDTHETKVFCQTSSNYFAPTSIIMRYMLPTICSGNALIAMEMVLQQFYHQKNTPTSQQMNNHQLVAYQMALLSALKSIYHLLKQQNMVLYLCYFQNIISQHTEDIMAYIHIMSQQLQVPDAQIASTNNSLNQFCQGNLLPKQLFIAVFATLMPLCLRTSQHMYTRFYCIYQFVSQAITLFKIANETVGNNFGHIMDEGIALLWRQIGATTTEKCGLVLLNYLNWYRTNEVLNSRTINMILDTNQRFHHKTQALHQAVAASCRTIVQGCLQHLNSFASLSKAQQTALVRLTLEINSRDASHLQSCLRQSTEAGPKNWVQGLSFLSSLLSIRPVTASAQSLRMIKQYVSDIYFSEHKHFMIDALSIQQYGHVSRQAYDILSKCTHHTPNYAGSNPDQWGQGDHTLTKVIYKLFANQLISHYDGDYYWMLNILVENLDPEILLGLLQQVGQKQYYQKAIITDVCQLIYINLKYRALVYRKLDAYLNYSNDMVRQLYSLIKFIESTNIQVFQLHLQMQLDFTFADLFLLILLNVQLNVGQPAGDRRHIAYLLQIALSILGEAAGSEQLSLLQGYFNILTCWRDPNGYCGTFSRTHKKGYTKFLIKVIKKHIVRLISLVQDINFQITTIPPLRYIEVLPGQRYAQYNKEMSVEINTANLSQVLQHQEPCGDGDTKSNHDATNQPGQRHTIYSMLQIYYLVFVSDVSDVCGSELSVYVYEKLCRFIDPAAQYDDNVVVKQLLKALFILQSKILEDVCVDCSVQSKLSTTNRNFSSVLNAIVQNVVKVLENKNMGQDIKEYAVQSISSVNVQLVIDLHNFHHKRNMWQFCRDILLHSLVSLNAIEIIDRSGASKLIDVISGLVEKYSRVVQYREATMSVCNYLRSICAVQQQMNDYKHTYRMKEHVERLAGVLIEIAGFGNMDVINKISHAFDRSPQNAEFVCAQWYPDQQYVDVYRRYGLFVSQEGAAIACSGPDVQVCQLHGEVIDVLILCFTYFELRKRTKDAILQSAVMNLSYCQTLNKVQEYIDMQVIPKTLQLVVRIFESDPCFENYISILLQFSQMITINRSRDNYIYQHIICQFLAVVVTYLVAYGKEHAVDYSNPVIYISQNTTASFVPTMSLQKYIIPFIGSGCSSAIIFLIHIDSLGRCDGVCSGKHESQDFWKVNAAKYLTISKEDQASVFEFCKNMLDQDEDQIRNCATMLNQIYVLNQHLFTNEPDITWEVVTMSLDKCMEMRDSTNAEFLLRGTSVLLSLDQHRSFNLLQTYLFKNQDKIQTILQSTIFIYDDQDNREFSFTFTDQLCTTYQRHITSLICPQSNYDHTGPQKIKVQLDFCARQMRIILNAIPKQSRGQLKRVIRTLQVSNTYQNILSMLLCYQVTCQLLQNNTTLDIYLLEDLLLLNKDYNIKQFRATVQQYAQYSKSYRGRCMFLTELFSRVLSNRFANQNYVLRYVYDWCQKQAVGQGATHNSEPYEITMLLILSYQPHNFTKQQQDQIIFEIITNKLHNQSFTMQNDEIISFLFFYYLRNALDFSQLPRISTPVVNLSTHSQDVVSSTANNIIDSNVLEASSSTLNSSAYLIDAEPKILSIDQVFFTEQQRTALMNFVSINMNQLLTADITQSAEFFLQFFTSLFGSLEIMLSNNMLDGINDAIMQLQKQIAVQLLRKLFVNSQQYNVEMSQCIFGYLLVEARSFGTKTSHILNENITNLVVYTQHWKILAQIIMAVRGSQDDSPGGYTGTIIDYLIDNKLSNQLYTQVLDITTHRPLAYWYNVFDLIGQLIKRGAIEDGGDELIQLLITRHQEKYLAKFVTDLRLPKGRSV